MKFYDSIIGSYREPKPGLKVPSNTGWVPAWERPLSDGVYWRYEYQTGLPGCWNRGVVAPAAVGDIDVLFADGHATRITVDPLGDTLERGTFSWKPVDMPEDWNG